MRLQSAIFDLDGTLVEAPGFWAEAHDPAALRETLAALPEGERKAEEARLSALYLQEAKPRPDVEKVLAILKMETVWMYVVSDEKRPFIQEVLDKTGLNVYFRGVLTKGDAGHGMDDPLLYEYATRRLRSCKLDTVIFSSRPTALKTANDAGYRTASVYDPARESIQAENRALATYFYQNYKEMVDQQTR